MNNDQPVTPMTYFAEIAASSWRHGGELALAMACAIALTVVTFVMLPARALIVLPAAVGAGLLFEAARAALRLHRRQNRALATMRFLLDQDAVDRAQLDRHLRETYQWREGRLREQNAARLEGLIGDMEALQTKVLGPAAVSHVETSA